MNEDAFEKQQATARAKILARRAGAAPPPGPNPQPPRKSPLNAQETALAAEMEADADGAATKTPVKLVLQRVSAMVATQRVLTQRVEAAEAELKRHKADLFRLESVDMPELLQEAGLSECKLEDGTKVTIRDEISCAITKDNNAEALNWLRGHGFGALIRCEVSVAFGTADYAQADKLALQLVTRYGHERVTQEEKVHPATLKSFIKERIAEAADKPELVPPYQLFSVLPYALAKITLPRGR